MYDSIHQFEPLIPENTAELEDLAFEVTNRSAELSRELHPVTISGIRSLLRVINSYYSNLIEGHNTHPIDVERAMHEDYSNDPAKRDRQIESLIHIDVQSKIENRLESDPYTDVANPEFLRWIHREFYDDLPESLRFVEGDGVREWVEAGEFRTREVAVGHHIPPTHTSINAFLDRFKEFYDFSRIHGTKKLIAIAAAHHRLMWVHPFLDGNGRVARLFTDACFFRIGLSGYGIWNVSRGVARRNSDYKRYLDAADFPREGDPDGRGNLSNRTLTDFCSFFLEVCMDQATYMSSILNPSDLLSRIENYVDRSVQGLIVDEKGTKAEPLHSRAGVILGQAALMGELPRSTIAEIVGMSDRTARNVTKLLVDEGLLIPASDWHRSPLRLGFPIRAAAYWFPNLFPEVASGY